MGGLSVIVSKRITRMVIIAELSCQSWILQASTRSQVAFRQECVPSQKGSRFVFLHRHRANLFVSSTSKNIGEKSVPAWEPSQNGWF